jgi:hypothetical protein
MAEPIIFISRHRLMEPRSDSFRLAFGRVLDGIACDRARTSLMAAYTDAEGLDVRTVHDFPDADALAAHSVGSDDRSASASGQFSLAGFEVYGAARSTAVDQLRREAAAARDVRSVAGGRGASCARRPDRRGG